MANRERSRRAKRRWLPAVAAVGAALLGWVCGACSEIAGPEPFPSLDGFLTGAALAAVDHNGRLRIPTPIPPSGAVSSERAAELSVALVETFAPFYEGYAEEGAGRRLDFGNLRLDERVLYMETPFQPTPEAVEISTRALLGPAYLLTFRDAQGPALAVSVSVYTADHWIEGKILRTPFQTGNQYTMVGLPISGAGGAFIQPELAVELVARASGARVTEVPQLVWRGLSYLKHVGSWRMTLDRDVSVRLADGKQVVRREIYVEPDGSFRVASGETRPALLPDSELSPRLQGSGLALLKAEFTDVLVDATLR